MKTAVHPPADQISLPQVLAALADPIRLGVVRLLADGSERGWNELRAPIAKSTLSHHMRVLRDAGITRTRVEGTRCFVRLRDKELESRFPGLVSTVIGNAEDVGTDVTLR
ncbi:MAG TPA: metalloregulator ArsR/SmtB family transcription factor [Stackebrandtia sp.]|jgi:DNA-binding transcriptional ArsR family regulator|uniref:ArsR/SmtB family transcription factor n=1 Tax=Stackebrandtia sp. TaxID=2023065 RepID=UPI002D355034|nr:metalloregulator ArsR/SmtB family transcription factor [Stackebrandtia sp.]HZE39710.1 metalloregulator ArsR/SmtB family transcription factor [Stackebrandtia sp.]